MFSNTMDHLEADDWINNWTEARHGAMQW
jgi:hypothetical protein